MSRRVVENIKIRILMTIVVSVLITLFGVLKVSAFYEKDETQTVSFSTKSYSALTYSLDKTVYPSGNNSATVVLTVTNPNAYAVTYTLSFSNTNVTYTIGGSAPTTYTVNANASKTNTIAISGATGTSITITINITGPYSATGTKTINFDNDNPVPAISGGDTAKQTNQTFNLSCTDSVGVTGYYWGTTEPSSSTTFTAVASTTNMTGQTETANSAATYWLGCKDAAGNIGKTSVVVRRMRLRNLVQNINGTETAYNTNHYTVSNPDNAEYIDYYAKNGTVFTVGNLCTTPTPGNSLKGYNAGSVPSSVTVSLTSATTNMTIDESKTINCWYNRLTYGVTITKHANGSTTASTQIQTNNSVTVAAGASSNGTLTVRYGDTVTATATPSEGYAFSSWSGGYLSGTSATATGAGVTAAKTITPSFVDNTPPTASFSPSSSSDFAKTYSVTITIADAQSGVAPGQTISYRWQTSSTCATSGYDRTAALSNTTNAAASATATLTADGLDLNGTYYLCVYQGISDVVGNTITTKPKAGTFKFDNNPPTVNDIGGGTTQRAGSQSLTLKCSDTNGVTAYYWGTSNPSLSNISTTTPADLTALASTSGLSKTVNSNGTYYFGCRDQAGNYAVKSIIIRKYQVQQVLLKTTGTAGTRTSTHYETVGSAATYYIKDGTEINLLLQDAPECSRSDTDYFIGYSTSAPSSSAKSLSTTNPTVATNNTTVYYLWYNRIPYTLKLIKGSGINTVSNGGTNTTNAVTYNCGRSVSIGATILTGYTWTKWTVTSGDSPESTTTQSTNVTLTQNTELTASGTGIQYRINYSAIGATRFNSAALRRKYDALYHSGNTTLTDISSKGVNGTVGSGVSFNENYMSFDGTTNSYVDAGTLADHYSIQLEAVFSISATPSHTGEIISNYTSSSGARIFVNTTRSIRAGIYIGGEWELFTATTKATLGKVHHVSFRVIYNSDTGKTTVELFVDGTSSFVAEDDSNGATVSSYQFTGQFTRNTTNSIFIGSRPSKNASYTFVGNIYSAAIYTANSTTCGPSATQVAQEAGKTVRYGSNYGTLMSNNKPVRSGYIFDGWYKGTAANSARVTSTTTVATADDHFLYAHWSTVGCEITASSSDYATSQTLTITETSGASNVQYSWDGSTWGTTNTKSVSAAGDYIGYVKSGSSTASCSISIVAKTQYRHDTCTTCGSCYSCSSGVQGGTTCYSGVMPNYGNMACVDQGMYFYNGVCYLHSTSATYYNTNCTRCACSTWNTSDNNYYDESCGSSNYSICRNRTGTNATRVVVKPE